MSRLTKIRYDKNFRSGGLKTQSRIFGYSPRLALRKDFCSRAKLNTEDPQSYTELLRTAERLQEIYQLHAPLKFKAHQEKVASVLPEYRMGGTVFTQGIINKDNQLKYHFDSGNFRDVFSAMVVFKHNVEGGHLVMPEYDIAFELKPGSVIIFDGQEILHGVSPIRHVAQPSFRYSVVFYSLLQMLKCEPFHVELKRIQRLKTSREQKRVEYHKMGPEEVKKVFQKKYGYKPKNERK